MYVRVTPAHDTSRLSPPPREVYRKQGLPIPIRWAIFWLTPPSWFGVFLAWSFATTCALALFGHDHQATVTSRHYIRTRRRGNISCQIDYAYRGQGGRHADYTVLGLWAYHAFPAGAPISVRSVRILGISTSQYAGGSRTGSFLGVTVALIFWDGIVLAIFYLWCLSPIIHWWLVRYGEAAMGQITGKEDKFVRIQLGRRAYAYKISYSYCGPDGAELTHKRRVGRIDWLMADSGQKLQVFYNPRWPRQHVLYQYSNYAPREWAT